MVLGILLSILGLVMAMMAIMIAMFVHFQGRFQKIDERLNQMELEFRLEIASLGKTLQYYGMPLEIPPLPKEK